MNEQSDDWEDVLGTGTVMKQVLVPGGQDYQDLDMEAPRKFFALIDVETKCEGKLIDGDSHKNYLINSDADLFPGVHLVIPLMDVGEESRFVFDSKFGYGEIGNLPNIPGNSKLECIISLKLRHPYDDFLMQLSPKERLVLAERKKERGKFWYSKANYPNAITIYKSLAELCNLDQEESNES